jgi:lysophospholipid acyltransferase (LPLAT)-like uncharacterized protein
VSLPLPAVPAPEALPEAPPAPLAPSKRRRALAIPNAPSLIQRAFGWIAAQTMRLLARTLRYRVHGGPGTPGFPDEPVIFVLWHNRLCLCMKVYESMVRPVHRHNRLAALISASKDGAFLASILQNFGVEPVRGSSSRRGAQALLELTSWARRGYHVAVTPDGPRGPRYALQDGVIALAQVTGLPIIPYSCQLRWKIQLKSWDRFQIPLPFSRCEMTFADPIRVPRDASDSLRTQLTEELRTILLAGTVGE